jgi:hypothetical protein
MDALRQSIASDTSKKPKKPRKAPTGQKEMLLPIDGKGGSEKKASINRVPFGRSQTADNFDSLLIPAPLQSIVSNRLSAVIVVP